MPIGSSKLGVLGAGLVPGGTETFNAPGTFSIPPGVKKVSITGVGGTGNPGVAGNPGNPGNNGTGGGGGANAGGGTGGSAFNPGPITGLNTAFSNNQFYGNNNWFPNPAYWPDAAPNFPSFPRVVKGGSLNNPPVPGCCVNFFNVAKNGFNGPCGNAGTSGCGGTAGNTGQSSSALGSTFPGGAGGAAPPGGNAGNAGSGGQGGTGSPGFAPPTPTAPLPGVPGGNGGGAGAGNVPCGPSLVGGSGGGGAGATTDGVSGQIRKTPCWPGWPTVNAVPFASMGGNDAQSVALVVPTPPAPRPSGFCYTNLNTNIAGGQGGVSAPQRSGGPVIITNWDTFSPNAILDPSQSNPQANILGPRFTTTPCNSNIYRSGGGGASGSLGNQFSQRHSGSGGGGRGNAGNAGGPSPTISGTAATPQTFNCVPVTPGCTAPITVGTPGGQVVISWNPQ
jgi:hypothetical protein